MRKAWKTLVVGGGAALCVLAAVACAPDDVGNLAVDIDEDEAVPERVLRLQEYLESGEVRVRAFHLPGESEGKPRSFLYKPDPLTPEGEAELRMMVSGPASVEGWDESEVELLVARMKKTAREEARKAEDGGSR